MLRNIPQKKLSQMECFLEFVNRLPLDKEAKLEFVKAHIETLKKYEKEIEDNKTNFNLCLDIIKYSQRQEAH